MPSRRRTSALLIAGALAVAVAGCGGEPDPIRIGLLGECRGVSSGAYEAYLGAVLLPLVERGAQPVSKSPRDGLTGALVAGREVEVVPGCEPAETEAASLLEVRRLVEREHADAVVVAHGEPWVLALRGYAKRHPEVTFVVGWGFAQSTTLRDSAPNLFSFFPSVLQQSAAAGAYAYNNLGWRRALTAHHDNTWGWNESAGFAATFCALGGTVVGQIWAASAFQPPDPASALRQARRAGPIDGVFFGPYDPQVLHALADGLPELHGPLRRTLIGTWWSLGDPSVGREFGRRLDGVVTTSAGAPFDQTLPTFARYMESYERAFPGQQRLWALGAGGVSVYVSAEALVRALEAVGGDLSGDQRRFRETLQQTAFAAPNGEVGLDDHRQVVATGWLNRLTIDAKGNPGAVTLPPVAGIDTTLGGYFTASSPPPSHDRFACRRLAKPPAWMTRKL